MSSRTVLAEDVAHFSAQADEWWRPDGAFRALHELGPLRFAFVQEQIGALRGKKILDVGCGGGLMSERLAAAGANVVGLDVAQDAIRTARAHAAQSGLTIDYRAQTAEALAQTREKFDAIVALEIVEHVADLPAFLKALSTLLVPGGTLVLATLNRTKRSFLLAVVLAEYVLGWVPPGTHEWDQFVMPSTLKTMLEKVGITPYMIEGVVYNPLLRRFERTKGRASVNYFMAARKESAASS